MADPISGEVRITKNADGSVKTVEESFSVSDAGVQRIRSEVPVGVGGQPIDRIPWNKRGEALVNAGTYVKRLGNVERCLRRVDVPMKGGGTMPYHCSQPCLSIGSEAEKLCPEHDREAFAPIQDHAGNPAKRRVTNSASIVLTPAEMQETWKDKDGKVQRADLKEGNAVGTPRATDIASPAQPERRRAPRAASAPRRQAAPKGGSIRLDLTIEELKGPDVVDVIRERIVDAINRLPAKNVAEMESVIAIRERVRAELTHQEEGR